MKNVKWYGCFASLDPILEREREGGIEGGEGGREGDREGERERERERERGRERGKEREGGRASFCTAVSSKANLDQQRTT